VSVEGAGPAGDGWPQEAAVVGAGTMGLGIAEALELAGVRVRLWDATPELTERALDGLRVRVRGQASAGLLPEDTPGRVEGSASAARSLAEAVRGADAVFEAAPERLELKLGVLSGVSDEAPEGAVLATNTSSLPIDELAGAVEEPGRFLGVHWFNPAEWIPGVEVIPGSRTDPEVVGRVLAFLRAIGKRPAVVGSGPGFVANRIQMALFREALACVEAGLATPGEVDEVVRSCFGFRLPFFGPFLMADMAGLDVYEGIFETLERGLPGAGFEAPEALRRLVAEGRVGAKGGAGFFEYTDEERERLLLERDRRYAALGQLLERLRPHGAGEAP